MARQSLYRRYRPQRFSEVRGQEQLTEALRRAVSSDRVGHAYLFSGPRGTGKTTTARILAKALNCEHVTDGEPCGECESCVSIAAGNSFDVIELDAASHNGVEEIRNIIDHAGQSTPGRHRVYILDEVHMLSKGAANALLKTLEEPPDHVVFILATTDPHKLPPTIRSRTQHFEVHLLDPAQLTELIDEIVADAGLDVDEETRRWAMRAGAGSARDTLSALERAVALGAIPDATTSVEDIVDAITTEDTAAALTAVAANVRAGRSPISIGDDLIAYLRLVFLSVMGTPAIDETVEVLERAAAHGSRLGARKTTRALEILGESLTSIGSAADPRVTLELAMVRLTQPELDSSPSALLARIERLEQALAGGAATAAAPAAPAGAPPDRQHPTDADGRGDPADGDDLHEGPVGAGSPGAGASGPGAANGGAANGGAADAARQALAARRRGGDGASSRRAAPASAPTPPPAPPTAPTSSSDPPPPAAVSPTGTADVAPATEEPPETAPPGNEPPVAQAPIAESPVPDSPVPGSPASGPPVPEPAADGPPLPVGVVTEAWQRSVTHSADQKVRARLGPAVVAAVEGNTVIVTLPSERAVQRGSELRDAARDALCVDLGRTVDLDIRVGKVEAEPQRRSTTPKKADVDTPDEDVGDVASLLDAEAAPTDDLDRVTEVFPGAEVVEVDPEPAP